MEGARIQTLAGEPAWSDLGARILHLQKTGKKIYDLLIVEVGNEGAR